MEYDYQMPVKKGRDEGGRRFERLEPARLAENTRDLPSLCRG